MASQPDGEDCSPRGLWDPRSKHKQKQSSGPAGKPPPTGERAEGPRSLLESFQFSAVQRNAAALLPSVRGLEAR